MSVQIVPDLLNSTKMIYLFQSPKDRDRQTMEGDCLKKGEMQQEGGKRDTCPNGGADDKRLLQEREKIYVAHRQMTAYKGKGENPILL